MLRRILSPSAIDGRLGEWFLYTTEQHIPLHMLIDEYDNFASGTFLVRRFFIA